MQCAARYRVEYGHYAVRIAPIEVAVGLVEFQIQQIGGQYNHPFVAQQAAHMAVVDAWIQDVLPTHHECYRDLVFQCLLH